MQFWLFRKRQKDIVGIFVSDIHNDNFSGIPWLLMKLKNIKIYTSAFNKIVLIDRISKYDIQHKNYEVKVINRPTEFNNVIVTPFELAGSTPGQIGFNFLLMMETSW